MIIFISDKVQYYRYIVKELSLCHAISDFLITKSLEPNVVDPKDISNYEFC